MRNTSEHQIVTRHRAATILGVSDASIEKWIANGDLPAKVYRDGSIRILLRDVLQFHERQKDFVPTTK